MCGLNKP